jgi:hypothetical protein
VVEENIKLRDNKKKTQVTKELNFSTGWILNISIF